MKKLLAIILTVVFVLSMSFSAFALTATATKPAPKPAPLKGSITASGSSALYPLVNYAASLFTDENPDVSITVNTGGSGTGLTQVADGSVNIGNSDVFAAEKLTADKAKTLVDHKVCVIGVAIVVNPDVAATVKTLTKQQLKDIFSGTIAKWKDVGGPDEDITIINRPSSSGTRALFKKYALDGSNDIDGNASLTTDDSGALAATIAQVKGSIGYLALSYVKNGTANVKTVALDNVAPTYANIYAGTYPVWGYEHMYTKGQGSNLVRAFLSYMVSPELNKNFEPLGYGVISKMKVTRN